MALGRVRSIWRFDSGLRCLDVVAPMNSKEQAKMRRLEIENDQMRAQIARHICVYGDQSFELIELRAQLQLLREILQEPRK